MNMICLTGHLVKEPTTAQTQSGRLVASCAIAVPRPFSKETDFFDFDAWEQIGEYLVKFGHTGDIIELSGTMENQKFKNKEGENVAKWRVRASQIKIYRKSANKENGENGEETEDDLPF